MRERQPGFPAGNFWVDPVIRPDRINHFMAKTTPPGYSRFLPALLILTALVAAPGCNLPFTTFLAGGRPPPGPPSRAGQPAKENTAAAKTPAAPAPTALERAAAAEKPQPVGPRLSAMIARDELEKLVAARVAFDASDQMRVGVREKVEVRVAQNLYEEFAKGLKDLGMDKEFEIASGSSVKADLSGDGFEIAPPEDDDEAVRGGLFAPWIWYVTPLKSGDQPLLLTMTVAIKVPGGADEKKDLVITKAVNVASSPGYSASRFLRNGWQWIAGGVALLLAGWLIWRQQT